MIQVNELSVSISSLLFRHISRRIFIILVRNLFWFLNSFHNWRLPEVLPWLTVASSCLCFFETLLDNFNLFLYLLPHFFINLSFSARIAMSLFFHSNRGQSVRLGTKYIASFSNHWVISLEWSLAGPNTRPNFSCWWGYGLEPWN